MSSTGAPDADLLVIARDGDAFEVVADNLNALARLGCPVSLLAGEGSAPAPLAHLPFRKDSALAPRAGLARGAARLLGHRARDAKRLLAETAPASVLLVLNESLATLVQDADRSARMTVYAGAAARWELTRRRGLAEVEELGAIERLVRSGRHDGARRRISRYRTVSATAAAIAAAWTAAMDLTEAGGGTVPESVVTDAIGTADRAWKAGRAEVATYALGAAMRVLFHPVLHADVPDPPLAQDPGGFLESIRASSMLRDVLAPAATRTSPEDDAAERRPSQTGAGALVLTGSYPRFSPPLVAALEDLLGSTVSVLALGTLDKRFNWLGMNTDALAWRVAAHPDGRPAEAIAGPPQRHAAVLDDYDLIVADWADRGAMWASIMCPPKARLVIRVHGMDLFSPWVHLIDWSRVDDLIFVSAPLRELGRAILGDQLQGVRIHTIEHGIDSARFTVPRPPGSSRTLGMIGWGKLVKDPAWTLDVLDHLVATDSSWRLLLIGHELPRDGNERAFAYADAFWSRLHGPLGDHVELIPQTDEVPAQAARLGFIISSSRRESFHLAVVEGVLAGAVPVVRDWPVYQHVDGPRAIFPPEWVVTDAADAATRIRALSEPSTRRDAAQRAHVEAVRRYSPRVFRERLRAVISDAADDPDADSAS